MAAIIIEIGFRELTEEEMDIYILYFKNCSYVLEVVLFKCDFHRLDAGDRYQSILYWMFHTIDIQWNLYFFLACSLNGILQTGDN